MDILVHMGTFFMNREDIIRMAKECGAYPAANVDGALLFWSESQVERFAALVASAEREACAKVCEDLDAWNMDDPASTAIKAIRAMG
jgi:hypothetical protein